MNDDEIAAELTRLRRELTACGRSLHVLGDRCRELSDQVSILLLRVETAADKGDFRWMERLLEYERKRAEIRGNDRE